MARPRTYKTQGIVLKQTPIGEADRILSLHTADLGKLRAVARGVRRPKSKLAGHLELLTHAKVSVAEGRSLDTIAEAETIHSFRGLREDLSLVSRAIYLADLVEGFTAERSPSAATFQLLLEALGRLQDDESPARVMRCFETQLLRCSGFGPELHRCVECRSVLEPGDQLFSSARGGILCNDCHVEQEEAMLSISLNAIKVLRFFQAEPYSRVAGLGLSVGLLEELERLLAAYIRHVLERELKSTEFMNLVTSGRRPAHSAAGRRA